MNNQEFTTFYFIYAIFSYYNGEVRLARNLLKTAMLCRVPSTSAQPS